MGSGILRKRIMNIVGSHQLNACLPAHAHQSLVHRVLCRNSMILQLQEKIPFAENLLVAERRILPLLIHAALDIALDLAGQTGA
ncbi:unknown [Hungatella hathewayi CAG:224]|nr:unknown [Hungatella hathewayi CAG:224]